MIENQLSILSSEIEIEVKGMKAFLLKYKPVLNIASTILIIFIFFNTEGNTEYDPVEGINLQESEGEYKIGSKVSVLNDNAGEYKVEEVASLPLNWSFMPVSQDVINIGFFDQNIWVKFLVDSRNSNNNWLLVLPHNSVRSAVFYSPLASGGFTETVYRSQESPDNQNFLINDIVFDLETENVTSDTFYLKVEANGPLQLPLSIWDQTSYENSVRASLISLGIFISMVIFIAVYYLYHFYKRKQKVYLYLLLFILSVLTTINLMSNYSILNLFPPLAPAGSNVMLLTLGLSIIFAMLYTGSILGKANKESKARRIFKYTFTATVLFAIFQFISFTFASVSLYLIALVTLINILLVTVTSRKSEYQFIKFHISSMVLLLVSLILYGMLYLAWIPLTEYYETLFSLTAIVGVLFSALALAAKERKKAKDMENWEKKTLQRLQLEVESLKQADANKNELLDVTAHSLRTPLYGMIGIAESLKEESNTRLNAVQSKQLNLIIDHGKKLAQKINDIKDFSRIKQNIFNIHVEPVSINQLVEEVLEVCRPLLKDENIRLYGTLSQNLPQAVADPYRLQQILYNLIDNAMKQTDEGEIVVSTKKTENQIIVTVRDTGHGIEPERIKNLFEPHQNGEGKTLGIGLHISKRLIELHGGWLKAESAKGEGTTFTFTVPAHIEEKEDSHADDNSFIEESSVEELPESPSLNLRSGKRVHVLVVEKEPIDRSILITQLQKKDYIVSGTGTGLEALKTLETQQVDIVILGGTLNDMDGNELCKRIRKKFILTEVPILMLSTKMGCKKKWTLLYPEQTII
nr:ATP-binding protein [Planococcus salinarum]